MGLRANENGQITWHQIVDILDEFRNGICDDVCQQIELIQGVPGLVRQPGRNPAGVDANRGRGTLYTYNGRLWDVPQTFAFYDFCETGCWVEVVAARDASLHDSG
jgi:hypothetical protein